MIYTLINSIVLMAVLMAIGFYIRKKGALSDEGEGALIYLLVNVTNPAMIINAMNIDSSPGQLKNGVVIVTVAVMFDILLFLLGKIFFFKVKDDEKKKIMRFSIAFMNGGFMGFPLIAQLYGSQGMFYATMFYIPNMAFMWTYGLKLLLGNNENKGAGKLLKSMFLNPGMIAIYAGLILYGTQLELPMFATRLLELLTNTTTVISMIIVGSKVATIGLRESFVSGDAYFATFLRIIISPVIMIIMLKFVELGQMIEEIFVIYASLPVAALSTIMAQKYGGDSQLSSKLVVITHLLSLLTIPAFFWLYTII